MGIESLTKGIGITYLLLVSHSVRQAYKESEKSQESKLHGSSRKSWISTDVIVSKNAKSEGAKSKTSADQSMGWTCEQRPRFLFDSHPVRTLFCMSKQRSIKGAFDSSILPTCSWLRPKKESSILLTDVTNSIPASGYSMNFRYIYCNVSDTDSVTNTMPWGRFPWGKKKIIYNYLNYLRNQTCE